MIQGERGAVQLGVFVQGRNLQAWEWRSIELLKAGGASCSFILAPNASPRRTRVNQTLDKWVRWIAGVSTDFGRELTPAEAQYRPCTTCVIEPAPEPVLTSVQKLQIAAQGFKFILFFGEGQVPEGLARCAPMGVWRFTASTGGGKVYPFIHGLQRGDDVVSFDLDQLTGDGSGSHPLWHGHFRARGERNRSVSQQILLEASRWPSQVLKHLLLNGELPRGRASGPTGVCRSSVSLFVSLLAREASVRLTAKLASYFLLETWNVGFVRMNARALLAGEPVAQVALLPRLELGRYVADPFVLSTSPELTLLAEDYTDFGVGRIAEVTIRDPFGVPEVRRRICMESRHHLSYPFLFRDEGITYCLPECHQSNSAVLYRYDAGNLTAVADLVPGARVTDGTILFHEGRYWLFCGLEDDNDQANLHLFFADALLGKWIAHPMNPVKSDVRSSRSAGPVIVQDGMLFRPAQDCSKSYGCGLSINRIDCLTVTRFEETVVATMQPEAISVSCKGLHTLSFADDMMVIDAKFHLVGFKPILVRLLRRIKRMAVGRFMSRGG